MAAIVGSSLVAHTLLTSAGSHERAGPRGSRPSKEDMRMSNVPTRISLLAKLAATAVTVGLVVGGVAASSTAWARSGGAASAPTRVAQSTFQANQVPALAGQPAGTADA